MIFILAPCPTTYHPPLHLYPSRNPLINITLYSTLPSLPRRCRPHFFLHSSHIHPSTSNLHFYPSPPRTSHILAIHGSFLIPSHPHSPRTRSTPFISYLPSYSSLILYLIRPFHPFHTHTHSISQGGQLTCPGLRPHGPRDR